MAFSEMPRSFAPAVLPDISLKGDWPAAIATISAMLAIEMGQR